MKNLIFLAVFILFSSCHKKNSASCDETASFLSDTKQDLAVLKDIPEIYDTLLKYPQLKVFKVVNDAYLVGFKATIYYQSILITGSDYYLYKSKSDSSLLKIGDNIPDRIQSPVTAAVSMDRAIEIAKQNTASSSCITTKLVITNLSDNASNPNLKLTWQVLIGTNMVILDANTGQVYSVNSVIIQ